MTSSSSRSESEPRDQPADKEADDILKVVRALRKVPETKLLLIEIARDSVTEDGELDIDHLSEIQREVNLAVAQANAYSKGTSRAVQSLKPLKAQQGER